MVNDTDKILIIDDDRVFCEAVSENFAAKQFEVLTAHSGADGLAAFLQNHVNIVLLDQKLPDGKGVDFCPPILAHNDQAKVIFTTAYPSFENALQAIRVGAHDYLSKPFELEELDLAVRKAMRTLALERVELVQIYKNRKDSENSVIIGSSKCMSNVFRLMDLAATCDAPVFITGETGTGKNLVAKAIHYKNLSRNAAFISINCGSLPENLIEAELFGYENGAFTGAVSAKKGIFEMAEGGTLLLDEIGELPLHLQSKILGVLDDQKIKKLGSENLKQINVRIIAATNRELENAVNNKQFRQDLYYRLSVLRIHIPPLRDRLEDLPQLCHFFIKTMAPTGDIKIPDSEIERLLQYHWPGNVRELKNIIERSIILRTEPALHPSELLVGIPARHCRNLNALPAGPADHPNREQQQLATLQEVEKNHIFNTLRIFSNNHTRTAAALGISRSTLMRKIKTSSLS